jgi:Lysyl oxidase
MQQGVRTGLKAVAVGAGCVLLATVLGMSRPPDPDPAASTAADQPATTGRRLQAKPVLPIPTPSQASATRGQYPDPKPLPVNVRLLPNLRSLPPEDIEIRITDGGQRQLWFTSIIANAGIGPAEVLPDELFPCPPGQHHASQVLYHDSAGNGRFEPMTDRTTTTRRGGCMLDHPSHDHWHFDAMARYALTRWGQRSPLVGSDKVSFCLRDNRETPSAAVVKVPQHYGDCGPNKVQGISPGWADVYDTDLPDQHLVLPATITNGSYCLHNEADPLGLLLETDETDNAAVIVVRITGNSVAVGPAGQCG